MKRLMALTAGLAVLLAGSARAAAEPPKEQPSFQEMVELWLPEMGAEAIPDRQESQQALQDALFQLGAPGREAELSDACKAIAKKLGPGTAKPARTWILKQLEFNGGAECVEAVAALLSDQDAEIRDCARRALQNNPAPEATTALLAALDSAMDDAQRIAIANALGYRKNPAGVAALGNLLGAANQSVAVAAVDALGKIGGTDAAGALVEFYPNAAGALRTHIEHVGLRRAERLLAQGKRRVAAEVYGKLDKPEFPRPIRFGAMKGSLNAAGDRAAEMVLEMLASDDADRRAIAAGHVENLAGPAAMKTLAQKFPELPAAGQKLLLAALAVRANKAAMPLAMAAANSSNEDVRSAGIQALGKLGDARAVPVLVAAMAAGEAGSDAARESLCEVFGDGVDEAIVTAMQKAQPNLRGTLIDVLQDRRAVSAAGALLEEAGHEDAGIRDRAIRALGELAGADAVEPLIALLLAADRGRQRDDIEKAIMFVCGRIPEADQRADPVLEVMSRSSEEDRAALLPLLGRIGGKNALEEVNRAIRSDKPEVQEAGVRAISNWPDASVAADLLDLAQHAENKTYVTWALRAYIRVVTLPSERPDTETLSLLKKAMEMATRDDERRLVVSRASSARHVETLRWLVPYLDDPAVSDQACRAIVDLARRRELFGPNQVEFREALKKVMSVTKNQGLIDQVERYMSGL